MTTTLNASTAGAGGFIASSDNSGVLALQTAGTTAVTIDTSGNVGIGTSLPAAKLSITAAGDATFGSQVVIFPVSGANPAKLTFNPAISSAIAGLSDGSVAFYGNGANTERMRIDSSGNVGIGTTTPSKRLSLRTSSADVGISLGTGANAFNQDIDFLNSADSMSGRIRYYPDVGYMSLWTASSERMRIDSSGSLCIGNSGNFGAKVNITFDPASTNGLLFAVSSGTFTNKFIYFQNSGGSQIGSVSSNNASVTYNTTSDYRIKTNIQPISGALAKVIQLKPVIYDWKPEFAEGSSQGFIAHELQAIVPECVTGSKDAVDADGKPVYQGIDTSFLVATLTAALQETKALIDTQAETINALTARVVALEGK